VKTLIVEDDPTSRLVLQKFLEEYGPVHIAADGCEAIEAVEAAIDAKEYYDLICLDIKMPKMDGHEALKEIRRIELNNDEDTLLAKIVMTTTLGDKDNVLSAFWARCDAYLAKPVSKEQLVGLLEEMGLV